MTVGGYLLTDGDWFALCILAGLLSMFLGFMIVRFS